MLSERFSDLISTIRFRLVLWMIVVVFVLGLVAMLGVRQLYGTRLRQEFDLGLTADVGRIRAEVRQHYPDWPRLEDNMDLIQKAHFRPQWFAEVFDERGKRLVAGGFGPELPKFVARESNAPFDEGPYRVIVARFEDPGLPPLFLRVGGSRQALEDDLRLLDQAMILRTLIILCLAPLGGYVVALRATRPISKIISTAARLQPSQLNERLPIRGTGDELDQLSQTINGMLDRIASYIERNREFVAHAAHELRSPLAALRSSVEVALNRERSPDEYATLLAEVMEECNFLSKLVNRLLILAEGDAGRLQAGDHSTRLDKIVRESLDMFEAVAELNDVRIRAGTLPAVSVPGDEFYLRQVVRNLLDNAIKFSQAGSQVTVGLLRDDAARRAVLTVQDQGIGIAAEDLPHIFERFYSGDKARQRGPSRHSSGLGLSICQTIVRALGGEITVASQVGSGSAFTVVLPLAADLPASAERDLPAA